MPARMAGSCTPPSKTRHTASSQPPHGGSQSVSTRPPGSIVSASSSSISRPTASRGDSPTSTTPPGQVPVALVGELAEQHPAVGVADEHLPDGALAGEEGVEQRRGSSRARSAAGRSPAGPARRTTPSRPGRRGRARPGAGPRDAARCGWPRAARPGCRARPWPRPASTPARPAPPRTARSRPASAPPAWRTPARDAPRTAPTTARPRRRPCAARRRSPTSLPLHLGDERDHRPVRVVRRVPALDGRPLPLGVTPSTGQPNQCAITSSWPATASSTSSSRQRRSVTSPSVRVGCSGTSDTRSTLTGRPRRGVGCRVTDRCLDSPHR